MRDGHDQQSGQRWLNPRSPGAAEDWQGSGANDVCSASKQRRSHSGKSDEIDPRQQELQRSTSFIQMDIESQLSYPAVFITNGFPPPAPLFIHTLLVWSYPSIASTPFSRPSPEAL